MHCGAGAHPLGSADDRGGAYLGDDLQLLIWPGQLPGGRDPRLPGSDQLAGQSGQRLHRLVIAECLEDDPFIAIIVLAGLQTIPETIYEQARWTERASTKDCFKLTLPMLKPVLAVALIFRSIDAIRVLDLIYVLTTAGPGLDHLDILYGYKYFNEGDFATGSAIALWSSSGLPLSMVYLKAGGLGRVIR